MDLSEVCTRAIRKELMNHDDLMKALRQSDGQVRVFFQNAPAKADVPYVVMTLLWGGYETVTKAPMFDILWAVQAISDNTREAFRIGGYIAEQLLHKEPEFDDDWHPYAPFTFTGQYNERRFIQGENFYAVGPTVRIRGVKEAS